MAKAQKLTAGDVMQKVHKSSLEQAVHVQQMALALFLVHGDERILTGLEDADFTHDVYRKLFQEFKKYWQVFRDNDLFGIHHMLAGRKWYDEIGGMQFLAQSFVLDDKITTSPSTIERTITMLRECRARRTLSGLQATLDEFATGDIAEILEILKQRAHEATDLLPRALDLSIKTMGGKLQDRTVCKVPTGFAKMDEALGGGIANGSLFILAARPGVGKTTLACNIAAYCMQRQGKVLFVSLEMDRLDIAERFACGYMHEPVEVVRKQAKDIYPNFDGELYIDDTRRSLTGVLTSLVHHSNCDLFIIDYLQLIKASEREDVSEVQEIRKLTREIKIAARDMDRPIVLLSQMNRATERDKHNREPVLADLRGSGTIEQDADYVSFLWDKNAKKEESTDVDDLDFGIEETPPDIRWILRKNRYGPPNRSYMLDFTPKFYLFEHKKGGPAPFPKKA